MPDDQIMPEDLVKDLRYVNKGRHGDGFPCELRLDYIDARKAPPQQGAWTHEWTISGTDWDPAHNRGEDRQLEDQRRARYTEYLLGRIKGELHKTKTILVRDGGRLIRRPKEGATSS